MFTTFLDVSVFGCSVVVFVVPQADNTVNAAIRIIVNNLDLAFILKFHSFILIPSI
ncbi:hypothetical protein D3C76_1498720 [compost metagenome]